MAERERDVYHAIKRFTEKFNQGEINDPDQKEYEFPDESESESLLVAACN